MQSTTLAPAAGAAAGGTVAGSAAPELITVRELIDDYMAAYAGRDTARKYRLAVWSAQLGDRVACSLTDDDVFHALEAIASQPARIFAGRDVDGNPIHKAKTPRRSPATLNRYQASLSAVYVWALKKRRLPKGTENPCRKIERQPENPGIVRFLSDEERARLLEACRVSQWDRLYVLVLMAITTGARRGELERLTWADIDFAREIAHVRAHGAGERATKNGDAKVLPLVPAVVAELKRLGKDRTSGLIFASRVKRDVAYEIEKPWKAALRQARVREFRFHDLRHTCASYLAQDGASLLEIADVMGHRQLAMVKRYAHLTTKSKAALVQRVLGDIQ